MRAYVFIVEDGDIVDFDDASSPKLSVKLKVSNFGETPAASFRYAAELVVKEKPYPQKNDKILPVANGPVPSAILAKGGRLIIQAYLADKDRDAFLQCLEGEGVTKAVFVVGCLQYEDVFERKHETRFCYEMSVRTLSEVSDAAAIRWKMTALHNSMS